MRLIRMVLLLAFLGGCSAARPDVWTKDEATAVGWLHDRYQCEKDMRQSTGALTRHATARAFYERCLEAAGYTRVP
jgi:hypothetical protein